MKRFLRKAFVAIAVIVMAVSIMPITQADAAVKLSASKKTVYVGEVFTLKVSGSSKTVKWSSSKKSVASVTQKGKVTAKKAGKATITAKVSGKSLKCAVTVNEKFSSKSAIKDISCELLNTGRGVVAVLKNNSKWNVKIDATLVYMKEGSMIGTSSDDNYVFEKGSTCALFFDAPTDENYRHIYDYDDYKITMSIEECDSATITNTSKIKLNESMGAKSLVVEAENSSNQTLDTIIITAIFFDQNNNPIGYDSAHAKCQSSGSVDYVELDFPKDEHYNIIVPSSYKLYVNRASIYSWQL